MEDVSFSYRAKEEIISKINSKPKADVCMMGMLTYCNCLSDDEISFLTENKAVADFFVLNTGRITGNENAVVVTEQKKRNGVVLRKNIIWSSLCQRWSFAMILVCCL